MSNDPQSPSQRVSVLFVCHGNTCRSVMAEALTRKRFGALVSVSSAGLDPQQAADAATAIDTLKTLFDLDMTGHVPQDVRKMDIASFDFIVALDKRVAKSLPQAPKEKLLVWDIDDPFGIDVAAYRKCALTINKAVSKLPFPAP